MSPRAQRDAKPRKNKTGPIQHCPVCAMPFSRPRNLAKHMARQHPDQASNP